MNGIGPLGWRLTDEGVFDARAVTAISLVRALSPEIGFAALALLTYEPVLLEERDSELLFTNLH
jgi:hypothetical protein